MHLVTCPNCKEQVVFAADQCPNCKARRPVTAPDSIPDLASALAEPSEPPPPRVGSKGIRYFLLGMFFLWLAVWTWMLVSGQRSLIDALDVTNPSALGLAAFVSIVIYGFIRAGNRTPS